MPGNNDEDAGRIELRTTVREDGRLDTLVLRDGVPVFTDIVDIGSVGSRQRFIRELKRAHPELTDTQVGQARTWLERVALDREPRTAKSDGGPPAPTSRDQLVRHRDEQADKALAAMPADIGAEAEVMLTARGLFDLVLADIDALGVVGERELVATVYLLATSRLLDQPLAGIIQGPSSSGKSFIVDTVAKLIPDEALIKATDLTANSLFYVEESALVHRFVVAGERRRGEPDELADVTRALREMLSSYALRKLVPQRRGDRMETELIVRHGPISYVESTTLSQIFDEDANRAMLLATDERSAQTRRVLDARASRAAGEKRVDVQRIIERHHALQRLLRRLDVVVPYAKQIAAGIPPDRPDARRALDLALGVVRAVALLHQRQRAAPGLQHGERIEASPADYRLAYWLLVGPLGRALGGDLTPAAERLGLRMFEAWKGEKFTASQAAGRDLVVKSASKTRAYLAELHEHGDAELVEAASGNRPHVYRMLRAPSASGASWLPHPDDIDPPAGEPEHPDGGVPPSSGDGSTGRQVAKRAERSDSATTTNTTVAPVAPGRVGAAGPAAIAPSPVPAGCPELPPESRSGWNVEHRSTAIESEPATVVAPSPRTSTVGESVRAHWPDAEEVKGWSLPGDDDGTSSAQS